MLMDHLREYNLKDLAGGVQYRLWGRTGAADDRLYLFWTGSSLEFNLRATELWVTLESSYMVFENWVDVLVNGELIQRFMVPQGRSEFCLFRGMDRSKARRVQIVRDTQAMHLDARNSLAICSVRTDGVFEEVPQPALRLEFIGDSLTSGEGLTGAKDYLEWNPGCFSAIHSYAFRATQMLGAECSILSQSGWGTCFSWEGVRREAMPLYYDQVCGVLRGDRNRQRGAFADWDFDSWKPDAVIVHLGTN
ncbi:MAG: GDSL family lipase, partial [Lachnospiraceae bacterium]|nr:GDSL family lipase [Lachnospiraceae bacterium]